MKQYNIYPSLLNDYLHYINETSGFGDAPWVDEQSLLDRINRKRRSSVAMSKGTIFENAVAGGSYPISSNYSGALTIGTLEDGKPVEVSAEVLKKAVELYRSGLWQTLVEANVELNGSRVRLYGYVDVIYKNIATDIKTGQALEFHAFRKQAQHGLYLLALNQMGLKIEYFDYFKTDFKDYSVERYQNNKDLTDELLETVSGFISFLELRREFITDPKIIIEL